MQVPLHALSDLFKGRIYSIFQRLNEKGMMRGGRRGRVDSGEKNILQ